MPNIPVHYTNAIDFFWLLSKFCSLGTAQALGFLSEEDIVFSFWMSFHYGAWYGFYDHSDQILLMMVGFVHKSQLPAQTFSKKIPHPERHNFLAAQQGVT